MICKVNSTKILLPQESKVSTSLPKLKSGPEDGDQGHGLSIQHQGPKRVCPVPSPTKVSKVSTFYQRLKTSPEDGDRGQGLEHNKIHKLNFNFTQKKYSALICAPVSYTHLTLPTIYPV